MKKTDDFTRKIKSKLSLDQAFSPQSNAVDSNHVQTAVLTDIQKTTNTDKQENRRTDIQPESRPIPQDFQHQVLPQPTQQNSPTMQEQERHQQVHPGYNVSHAKYKKKMTFNITDECFDRFQKIHATRLYQGRATEKGELISECINLLFDQEKRNGYITN